jgi:hypothetical protein
MAVCARKTGLRANNFNTIFNKLMLNSKDSLWLDSTEGSKYGMRKNGFTLIKKIDGEKAMKDEEGNDKFIETN